MQTPQLEADTLVRSFGQVRAVAGLSLKVHAGEIVGLLGPNGAGKTTFVRLCSGQLTPDSGQVRIAAEGGPLDPCLPRARAAMGVAPQGGSVFEGLSVHENLELFAGLHGLRGAERRRGCNDALDFAQLADLKDRPAGQLSGGQRQRLNLALAMVHGPGLLFLDEPTVGVDTQSRAAILEGVKHLRERGAAILYTTHYLQEAEALCDRIGIMDHGRLLALDSLETLLANHGGPHRILLPGREPILSQEPWRDLQELAAHGHPGRVRVESPDLEQVFLDLTGRALRD
ncbi:MAG: ABC transporter ATP-binding protein [Candidatus Delongbacteria bacterium]|nr:ABC transporter ATP-binding protein [Candidatus Delongbacteria bacterium]